MNIVRVAILSLTICAAPSAAQPSDEEAQTINAWGEVTDPDGDCKIMEMVTITVPNTHHDLTYTENYTKLNSPRILQPVEGDFTLQVKVMVFTLPGDAASSGGRAQLRKLWVVSGRAGLGVGFSYVVLPNGQ